jgi:hypothetical protein
MFTWIYFHHIFYLPLPQSVQVYVHLFYVTVIHDFPIHYTVICKKFNSLLSVPPNIIFVCGEQKWAQYTPLQYP